MLSIFFNSLHILNTQDKNPGPATVHTDSGVTMTPASAAASTSGSADEVQSQERWWLTVVYGPQDEAEKTLFLEEITAIRDQYDGAWVIVGDFNLILDEADKNNGRINRRTMRRFRRTVAELELMDIHLHGRRYTWSNERQRPNMVRLDWALASLQWEERFPSCHSPQTPPTIVRSSCRPMCP
jgi:uncharacterized protein with NRDE domain